MLAAQQQQQQHLLKLELDWLDKGPGHKLCSLSAQLHGSANLGHLEVHHHTVCVPVYHFTVCLIPIGLAIRLGYQVPARALALIQHCILSACFSSSSQNCISQELLENVCL